MQILGDPTIRIGAAPSRACSKSMTRTRSSGCGAAPTASRPGSLPRQPVIDTKANRVYVGVPQQQVTVVNSHVPDGGADRQSCRALRSRSRPAPPSSLRRALGHACHRGDREQGRAAAYRSWCSRSSTRDQQARNPVYAGRFTRGVAVNPLTGRIYVSNLPSATVTILSPELKVVQRVPVGYGPRCPAFNPNTDKLYVGKLCALSYPNFRNAGLDGLPDTISVILDKTRPKRGQR